MGIGRARRAVCALLILALLLTLAGCGGAKAAQLRTGRKLMKAYLSGLGGGAALESGYVEVLRPDADKLVATDFVKGLFRAGGETYEYAVNTVTGGIYTSERFAEFAACCAAQALSRLGLDADDCVTVCGMTLYAQPWQTPRSEWPWERSCLGQVLPADTADMDGYVSRALADEDVRVQLFIACRADELREGRWNADTLSDWKSVEVRLFGFAPDEPLPTAETFPKDYFYAADRPCITLNETGIIY